MAQNPGVAVPMSDDLALQLPGTARPEDDFYDPQLRRGALRVRVAERPERHAAWGSPRRASSCRTSVRAALVVRVAAGAAAPGERVAAGGVRVGVLPFPFLFVRA